MSGAGGGDHFSAVAQGYARYRPVYPAQWFARLAELAPGRQRAWDCGAGSGQAAAGLAEHFDEVIASDISAEQLDQAPAHARVTHRVLPAEHTDLAAGSVDLIAAAQALHWFDLDRFYAEARRVARSGAILVAWSYGLARVIPAVDRWIDALHGPIAGAYWPRERRHVDAGYRTLPFPFPAVNAPPLDLSACWRLDDLLGSLRTWSAVARYEAATGEDPVTALTPELRRAWGSPETVRRVRWPVAILAGRL